MTLDRKSLLEAVKSGGVQPLTKRALARRLGITGNQRRDLRKLLQAMTRDGTLVQDARTKTYRLAGDLPNVMVLQIARIDRHGDLIAHPAKWDGDGLPPDILITQSKTHRKGQPAHTARLGVGDRALCRLKKTGDGLSATVIKKLGRSDRQAVGYVVKTGRGIRIRPAKKGSRYDYLPEHGARIEDGDIVAFVLTSSRHAGRHRGERIARVVKKLGSIKDNNAASLLSLLEHNIPTGFSTREIEEAKALRLPGLDKHRKDLRDLPLITIDPVDAKDFDDAVYACADADAGNKGGYIVWVAIADVSAFVTPGSVLDKEAYKRGNSVYLPDRVEPMLPMEISADLCSLRPHEERACLAVKMRFDKHGDKISHEFVRGLMRSHARLTYAQAQAGFDGKPGKTAKTVLPVLRDIYSAYHCIQQARARRAPLEIELPERKVCLNEKGKVTGIKIKERFDAHKLIEEFMIQANVCAAQALEKARQPLIYRVHEPPEREKLQGLADFLPAIGLKWSLGERPTPKRFNRLLEMARARELEDVVSMSILRAQMKAYYSPKNKGHFGLNLTHYAHFTSPIRRYADLIVHRALIKAFSLGAGGMNAEEAGRLDEIADHISQTERAAVAAERDAVDRYVSAYLSEQVGAVFGARITGVTGAGLFIMLDETGADGFVPVRTLGFERFVFDEKSKSLIGAETGGRYKFGRKVEVRLLEAMPLQGGLVFEMLSKPEKGERPRQGRGRRAYASRRPPRKGRKR